LGLFAGVRVLVTLSASRRDLRQRWEPVCQRDSSSSGAVNPIRDRIGRHRCVGQVHTLAATTAFTSSLTGLILSRWLRQFVWKRHQHESELRKILIVGGGPLARCIASTLRNDPLRRATICGFVDDDLPLSPAVLGRVADLDWLARAQFIDEVILVLPGQPARMREAAEVAYRNHLDIRAVPDLPPGPWTDGCVDRIGEVPVVTLHREPLPDAALFLKRAIDVMGAALGIAVGSPVMAVVALLIRLDSPGSVIYSAERTGVKGRRFRCYKFRSMVTNAEHLKEELRERNQRQGPIFKIDNDPRITRIGRIIRRYSLDELPQLWNVLRGEMSLVGPRPSSVDEVNHYELQHYRRLDVRPASRGCGRLRRAAVRRSNSTCTSISPISKPGLCGWTCSSWPARFACCSRRKEPDLATNSNAVSSSALTWDQEDKWQWRAAAVLLRPLHLGLAFPSVLYVAG